MITCLSEIFSAGKCIMMHFELKLWEAYPGLWPYKSWRLSY